MKKKSKRTQSKWPALNPQVNLKIRREELEIDYLDKLSNSEKDWLNRFSEEDINTNFDHPGDRIYPKEYITKIRKNDGKTIRLDKHKNRAETRNNKRNCDALARGTGGRLKLEHERNAIFSIEQNRSTNYGEIEDAIIERIDLQREIDE